MENDHTPTEHPAAGQDVGFDDVAAAATRLQDEGRTVDADAVRAILGAGSTAAIFRHLAAWRASRAVPAAPPPAELPEALLAGLADWARQFADASGAGTRDALAQSEADMAALLDDTERLEGERDGLLAQVAEVSDARDAALAVVSERGETIERLTAELNNARQVAMEALVGKAKDQLAIEGKDAQLADLRAQVERNVTATASLSDARLAAQMELIGATTARDSLAAENQQLRTQIESLRAR